MNRDDIRRWAEHPGQKKNTYPKAILDQFRAVQRNDKQWAIELSPGKYLHWIEVVDDKPLYGVKYKPCHAALAF